MAEKLITKFLPPGPVSQAFFESEAVLQFAMGPFGCSKTSCWSMKIPTYGMLQTPSPIDGIRRTKFTVLRDTYRNLEKTTIPSYLSWVPKAAGKWTGGSGGVPAQHHIRAKGSNYGVMDIIVDFVAIGDNSVEDLAKGLETTWVILNEADRLIVELFRKLIGRVGRYPSMRHGGPRIYGIICDYNAPDYDNWCYKTVEEQREEIIAYLNNMREEMVGSGRMTREQAFRQPPFEFFKWPSGFAPDAENLQNLTPGYYETMVIGMEKWEIRRFIENKYGFSRDGMPVYPEFSDEMHVAENPLVPMPKRPLVIGLDAGRTPAAVPQQMDPEGQLRWYPELTMNNVDAKAFGLRLKQLLAEDYPDCLDVYGSADPSAEFGSDTSAETWIDIVASYAEIEINPAPSQDPQARQSAVKQPLTRMITANKPAFLLCPNAKMLRKGFNNGYHYRRVRGQEGRYEDRPNKNQYSHPMEAGEYGALELTGYEALQNRNEHRGSTPKLESFDDPFAF